MKQNLLLPKQRWTSNIVSEIFTEEYETLKIKNKERLEEYEKSYKDEFEKMSKKFSKI